MGDMVEIAANGTARIVRPLNQYKAEFVGFNPGTLYSNPVPIRIVRKNPRTRIPRKTVVGMASREMELGILTTLMLNLF